MTLRVRRPCKPRTLCQTRKGCGTRHGDCGLERCESAAQKAPLIYNSGSLRHPPTRHPRCSVLLIRVEFGKDRPTKRLFLTRGSSVGHPSHPPRSRHRHPISPTNLELGFPYSQNQRLDKPKYGSQQPTCRTQPDQIARRMSHGIPEFEPWHQQRGASVR